MDDKAELVAFARESAKSGLDLYGLLGVDGSTSRDDIHRAWRRKGLKYHPDKAGADYDPTLYERFAHARDVLVDEEARKVYDSGRAAAAQRRLQSEQMSAERRRFKDELEAAEREHGTTTTTMGGAPFAPTTAATAASERDKLREAGRRRAEERQRREQEANARTRQKEDERIAEIEQRLREKEDKARRRAEKKTGGAAATSTAETAKEAPPVPQPDAEWRQLLKASTAQAKAGDAPTVQQRPLFAYTMDRLRAAGEAQRRQQAAAGGGDPASTALPPFEPQWDEIDDPEVRKFITRVPRFAPVARESRTGDVPMDTAA